MKPASFVLKPAEAIRLGTASDIIGCSRAMAYLLARAGELRAVRIGGVFHTSRLEAERMREIFQRRQRGRTPAHNAPVRATA